MAKYRNNMMSYSDWIKSHSKKELVDLIIGDDATTPLVTRNEPKFTRPQLIWAIHKLHRIMNTKGWKFDYTEEQVDTIISLMEGFKWNKFYNYDYIRFDVRKPSLYIFLILIGMGVFGIIKSIF